MRVSQLLLFLTFCLSLPAFSDNNGPYNRIHLTANAEKKVENDIITANLYAEVQGEDLAKISEEVNRRIQEGMRLAKSYRAIHVQSGNYSTIPVYKDSKIIAWRVRQSIELESSDITSASSLLGKLQNVLALKDMRFTLSPETRTKVEDELSADALAAFEHRASLITEQLHHKHYKIVEIQIHSGNNPQPYVPLARANMAMDTDRFAVITSEQTSRVTVIGTIELE